MLFEIKNKGSLEVKMMNLMEKSEKVLEQAIKASGCSVLDMISGLDSESGAMVGSCVELYKDAIDLSLTQAQVMDNMVKDLEELKDMNETLCKQNGELQDILRRLDRRIDKIGERLEA